MCAGELSSQARTIKMESSEEDPMHRQPQTPTSPLLSDEELDALIQAFNRRESVPSSRRFWGVGAGVLAVLGLGLWYGGWWG